jgi:serine/threonine-protein kinase SRK2
MGSTEAGAGEASPPSGVVSFPDPLGRCLRYEKLSDIAGGSFGFVQRCVDKVTGEEVAAKFILRKVLSTNAKLLTTVEREVVNHSRLVHPFIISFKDFFLLEKYLVIIQELGDQGDLADYIMKYRALPEEQARRLFQQYLIALDYMHRNGIVNRDIKPGELAHDSPASILL